MYCGYVQYQETRAGVYPVIASGCLQLFDCILANLLDYNISETSYRKELPGERVFARTAVTFMMIVDYGVRRQG